jgi:hypothetical protein
MRGHLGLAQQDLVVTLPQSPPKPTRKCMTWTIDFERDFSPLHLESSRFAAWEARFQQQLSSLRDNDDRIRQSLRSHCWTESQIRRSSSSSLHPAPMTAGDDYTGAMYALSNDHVADDSLAATRGSMGNTTVKPFTPS